MLVLDDKLLGFGYSVVSMWDHQTGDLLLNIDIDLPIGDNLGCFLASENVNHVVCVLVFKR